MVGDDCLMRPDSAVELQLSQFSSRTLCDANADV